MWPFKDPPPQQPETVEVGKITLCITLTNGETISRSVNGRAWRSPYGTVVEQTAYRRLKSLMEHWHEIGFIEMWERDEASIFIPLSRVSQMRATEEPHEVEVP